MDTQTIPKPNRILQHWFLTLIIAALYGCAITPEINPSTQATTARPALVNYALSLQGAPYRYGKASPEEGFDCSGFVYHVYQQHGIALPRRARDMAQQLPSVPKTATAPGDLVFFDTGAPFSHVGIYVENGDFIHAPSKRTGHVMLSNLKNDYWQKRFMGVRRP